MKKLLLPILLVVSLILPAAGWAAETTVTDLVKAYENWQNQGLRLVIRDSNGNVVDQGIGKLESWAGESKWVVRNARGHFLLHARGKVENWQNGRTKLVLRTQKGHLLTHININLTSRASFSQNVVSLRRLQASKFLNFVQETLTELIIKELKGNDFVRARVLITYLDKYHTYPGSANFKPILKGVSQQLKFMGTQQNNKTAIDLSKKYDGMLSKLR
jgi:hypothetical protein